MQIVYFHYLLTQKKNYLKRFAFMQKPERNLLFTTKAGIDDIFLLYKSRFNIDQYVLGAALESLSLLVIVSM